MDKFWALQQSLEKQAKGDDVGLDMEYDGTFRPAGSGAGFVREKVKAVGLLVAGVQTGEASLEELIAQAEALLQGLEKAQAQMLELADKIAGTEVRRQAFLASAEAFERGCEALKLMMAAIRGDDLETLLRGQADFEASARELDALVAEERTEQ